MFTGIIETVGLVKEVITNGSNLTFWLESTISDEMKVDQSVSHNGVCLTVEEVVYNRHRVTAIDETLQKTSLGGWRIGSAVNLERCLKLNDRLDGHFVQGHVDTTGTCVRTTEKNGSWEYTFEYSKDFAELIIEKGSVCVNGVSLTAFNVKKKSFAVAIIPYTYNHTNFQHLHVDEKVNLEFDLLGKYILRRLSLKEK